MFKIYSRDFGGIKSDGQLYNLEREYNQARRYENYENRYDERENCPEPPKSKGALDFLRRLEIDDLILIGIGILLLLDSDEENDIFLLMIALVLLF